ncbi:hypothetical protein R3P38DRAFT_3221852 [Favolaschia claudopus]|uniref:Uncharacterized protein n=1 Tax=Favolaschia claudopus TaxID=2862362 RepID=A0AAV9ZZN9_9AGAR
MVGGGIKLKKESGGCARIRAHRSPADRAMMVRAEGAVRPSETGRLFALVTITAVIHQSVPPPPRRLSSSSRSPSTPPRQLLLLTGPLIHLDYTLLLSLGFPTPPFRRKSACFLRYPISAGWLQHFLHSALTPASPQSSYLLLGLVLSGLPLPKTSSFRH